MAQHALLEDDEATTEAKPVKKERTAPRATAETMAAKQRDISVSEFFAKNRHLLGFDNPRKALLTAVKEAVDNSLDACEEAGILPEIVVVIEELGESGKAAKPASKDDTADAGKKSKTQQSARYRVTVVDNGPGIVRKQVENVFGRLLFGSKFHRLKMSRGQQGIGISAAGMYGLITTGRPMVIHTKPKAQGEAHHIELAMNTKLNRAEVTVDTETDDFPPAALRASCRGARDAAFMPAANFPTGTSVSIELEGKYQKGRGSVDEFLELTAIANPHARVTFVAPSKTIEDEVEPLLEARKRKGAQGATADASEPAQPSAPPPPPPPTDDNEHGLNTALKTEERDGVIVFPRAVAELPPETKEIQPHPRGIELGILLQMLKEAPDQSLYNFLQERFSRVSSASAGDFCKAIGASNRVKCQDIDHQQAEKLFRALQEAKLPPPPTDCLAPIGVRQLLAGLLKGVKAEFYAASSREPDVYRGRPFLIEAAIAFGGDLAADDTARVIRFANRVPLLYQQSACSSFKAVVETNWRNYDLQQPRGAVPVGPIVVMIHMASVWVPFTSESKEAIADYDEIRKEMKLALMECGRKLGTYLRKRARMRREGERRDVFQKYIGEIAKAIGAITETDAKKLYDALLIQAKQKTAIADARLDDEGKRIKEDEESLDGVVIIPKAGEALPAPGARADAPAMALSKKEAAKLKVAAMAHEDEPSLLDVRPVGRLSQKDAGGKKASARTKGDDETPPKASARGSKAKAAAKAPSAKAPSAKAPSTKTPSAKSPSAQASAPKAAKETAAKGGAKSGEKPKMRLVNGKLVPVDEGPKLF